MNTISEAIRLHKIVTSAAKDPLKAFVAQVDADQLEEIRKKNLHNILAEARKFKLGYIHIGTEEICGCEGKRDDGGTWPAIWKIAERVGFPGSCGNSDQYQTHDAGIVFPADSFGGWDVKAGRKLTQEETDQKKFAFVVQHFRGKK
jgi:hypothetical protein